MESNSVRWDSPTSNRHMKTQMMRQFFVLAVAVLLLAGASQAQAPATTNAVLVELFTSEGCSSCPPADALLQKLDGKATAAGQTVVALSEHVTYWNQLGWSDPFSQQKFTDRQNSYGERFDNEVYTPQMVVNGDQQVLGSDGPAILKALATQSAPSNMNIKIMSATPDGKMLSVTFVVSGELPRQGVDIMAAVTENRVSSAVNRGENSGRTLTHVAVVRSMTKVATLKEGATQTVKVPLGNAPAGTPHHLVMFAQTAGLGKVVGVATLPL